MLSTDDTIINAELVREGLTTTNDPDDKGGLTVDGISQKANPDLFIHGHPTLGSVRLRFEQRYVEGPGFDHIINVPLRTQLIDFGINSGPMIAIQKLQEVLSVPVDGILGPKTLAAVTAHDPRVTNNALVAARIAMLSNIVARDPSQAKYLTGWVNRAKEFLV
jgi:lysozyme family protein